MTILQKDDRIGGYHIQRLIGRGGMGEIYLARQTSIDRHVALKVLNPQLVQRDPKFAEQFTREAQAAGRITHPGIIAVHDVGRDTVRGGTVHYFSMEYVDGEDFRAILEREGPLDRELAAEVMTEIARALAYAARMGMVHRDVKPENIMRTRDGRIKLADFGLAMHITEPEDEDRDDQGRRKVLGTPRYMSPEQARGHTVDHRSDQYSFGATLFHLITGHPPYRRGSSREMMRAHVTDPVPDPAEHCDLPPGWRDFIRRLMSKDPAERYPDPDSFEQAAIATATRTATPPRSRTPRRRGGAGRRAVSEELSERGGGNGALVLIAVLLLAGLGGGAALLLLGDDDEAVVATDQQQQEVKDETAAAIADARAFIAGLSDDPAAALATLRGPKGLRHPYLQSVPEALALLQEHEQLLTQRLRDAAVAAKQEQLDRAAALIEQGETNAAEAILDDLQLGQIDHVLARQPLQRREGELRTELARKRLPVYRAAQLELARAHNLATLDQLQASLATLEVAADQRDRLAQALASKRTIIAEREAAERQQQVEVVQERSEEAWKQLGTLILEYRGAPREHRDPDYRRLNNALRTSTPRLENGEFAAHLSALEDLIDRAEAMHRALDAHLQREGEPVQLDGNGRELEARLIGTAENGRFMAELVDSDSRLAVDANEVLPLLPGICTRAAANAALEVPELHRAAFLWIYGHPAGGWFLNQAAESAQTLAVIALLKAHGRILRIRDPAATGDDDEEPAEGGGWEWDFASVQPTVLALFDGADVALSDGALVWDTAATASVTTATVDGRDWRVMPEASLPSLRLGRDIPPGCSVHVTFRIEPGSVALLGLERDNRYARVAFDARGASAEEPAGRMTGVLTTGERIAFAPLRPLPVGDITTELVLVASIALDGTVSFAITAADGSILPALDQAYELPGTEPLRLVLQTIQTEGTTRIAVLQLRVVAPEPAE